MSIYEKKKKIDYFLNKANEYAKYIGEIREEIKASEEKNIKIENEITKIEKMVSVLNSLDSNFIDKHRGVLSYIERIKKDNKVYPFLKEDIEEQERILKKTKELEESFDSEKKEKIKIVASLLTKARKKQKERIKKENELIVKKNNFHEIANIVSSLHAHDYYFLDNYKKVLLIIYSEIDPEIEGMEIDVSDEISIDDARNMIEQMRSKT